jgi:hypothetical protein
MPVPRKNSDFSFPRAFLDLETQVVKGNSVAAETEGYLLLSIDGWSIQVRLVIKLTRIGP